ncbi:cysteine-rich receptor-like protein kinase 10 isoform X3 [Alnus glutinosa]|uniref:cysteine-rich receptor-like protein kinase 10 isoform X3 n=1 Tax=Alnus glutinosa TaxID=3517 RepID=UPI002D76A1D4|nr:cysteine-rich receptor-like protein kinase 10 isoform X3 [Alnus glutinosa]
MGMASFNVSTTLVVFTLLCMSREAAGIEYLHHICSNSSTVTFTPNSTYQSNLYQLLFSLSSNAGHEGGFYNTTVGQNASDTVYGLFLCRGDLSTQECQDYVDIATQEVINQYCPIQKTAVIWYEECMLRYSDQYFFSTMNTLSGFYVPSHKNISADSNQFNQLLMLTMNDSVSQVANVSTGAKKFATKEANFMGSQILYTLEQCMPDVSSSDCSICIRDAISSLPECCSGLQGARVILPSCRIRYEIYPFYRMLHAERPPPMPAILPPPLPPGKRKRSILFLTIIPIVALISVSAVLLIIMIYYFLCRRAKKEYNAIHRENVEAATAKFSDDNKLGAGGFGEVYKGTLPNKQEVAVKRLSKRSGQGEGEFKNEIELVAKLHHKNLVRLLGFCLEGEEKILIYEFVPNKSLDYFLYDPQRQGQLDWSKRYKIIKGIARGILYLHEDSRLRIIHRDLKSSNVLLDGDMNPKISDFGLAKLFEIDQTRGHTRRIAGTLGYMPPEYAIRGQFSVKSDVYGFGILILEILSGNKINSFYQSDGGGNLLSYAWKHWRDGTPLELLDPTLRDSYLTKEFMKCLQIGLLCVQEDPTRRPTIASIVLMLNKSQSVIYPSPQQPAYCSGTHQSMPLESVNETPMTDVSPR